MYNVSGRPILHKQNAEYLFATLVTLLFSVLYGILEYYWIITDRDVPFRYGNQPVLFGQFNTYHIYVMFPIFILVAFSPFLDDLVVKANPVIEKWYTAFLGVATVGFAVLLEDATWFLSRVVNPLRADTFAGKWIQSWMDNYPSEPFCRKLTDGNYVCIEWTAQRGFVDIAGVVIPYWYIVVGSISVVVWFFVFRHLSGRAELYRILRRLNVSSPKLNRTRTLGDSS